jgi:cytidine deaminase
MATYEELIEKAKEASKNAYAPYSDFRVGACVLMESGNIYTGCNFENASYGLSICAERNAIGSAIANGETKIKAIAIYSPNMYNCTPCGACRQVINEFKTDETVVITVAADKLITHTIDELLPGGFTL